MNELDLWSELKKGDNRAFKEIYDLYAASLINYGRKFTSELNVIEDCMHDLFVNIWKNRNNLSQTDSIIKYLCVSLRREIIRKIQNTKTSASEVELENIPFNATISWEETLIEEEENQAQKQKLAKAFEVLSSRQKEAVYLRYFEEMEYDDICTVMDINYQSVRNLISKAIQQMRDHSAIFFVSYYFIFN